MSPINAPAGSAVRSGFREVASLHEIGSHPSPRERKVVIIRHCRRTMSVKATKRRYIPKSMTDIPLETRNLQVVWFGGSVWLKLPSSHEIAPHPSPKVRKIAVLRRCIRANVSKSDKAVLRTQINDMPMETLHYFRSKVTFGCFWVKFGVSPPSPNPTFNPCNSTVRSFWRFSRVFRSPQK